MAAKGVLCLVLLSGLGLALARSYEQITGLEWAQVYPPPGVTIPPKPLCDCINPFTGTANAWK